MGVNSGPSASPDGLIYCLDPANPRSYPGTGTGVTELSRVSANPTLNSGVTYYANPKGYFEFDGVNDNIPFTLTNFGTTTTVEIWMKMKAFVNGMPFGFNSYDVYAGSSGMGFNTAAGDIYGLTSTQVTNLGLLNQWKHYVFEMRSDVSYTNNKIYINGQSQTLSQVSTAENAGNRTFNSGSGRISCWLQDNNYHQPMDIALFRVYNRALTQSEITNNYNILNKRFNYLENMVTNGLALYLDASKYNSYSGTGTSFYDLSGNNKHSTLVNGIGYSSRNAGAIVLDGTNDYVQASLDTSLFSNEATMCIWLQNQLATPVTAGTSGFLGFGQGQVNDHYPYVDGVAYLSTFRNVRVEAITLSSTINRANPHMVSVTTNSTDWRLYQNSTLQYTGSSVGSVYLSRYTIGYSINSFFYQGNVFAFMIYNRALSADEILQNYNAFKGRYGIS